MQEIDPQETTRAAAFELWMNAPMPMVTFFRTLNITRLIRISHRKGVKLNMLLCWCIGRAASRIKEFYMLPVDGKLMLYDTLAVCTIVANSNGEVSSCDVPFSDDLHRFNSDYLRLTARLQLRATTMTRPALWSSVLPLLPNTKSMAQSVCTAECSTIHL